MSKKFIPIHTLKKPFIGLGLVKLSQQIKPIDHVPEPFDNIVSVSKVHFGDFFEKSKKIALVTLAIFFALREKKGVYAVTIEAQDGAPSSVFKNGRPNTAKNKFRIVIADKNDNPPEFEQREYHADIPEDADMDAKVLEVEAKDSDTEASLTTYQVWTLTQFFSVSFFVKTH